jgi:hypothetical protein
MCQVFALILILDQTIPRPRRLSPGKYILHLRHLAGIGQIKGKWSGMAIDPPAGGTNLSLKIVPSLDPILGTFILTTRVCSKYMKASQVRQTYRNTCTVLPTPLTAEDKKPLFDVPTVREYFMDLDYILGVISDGPAKSFASRRLKYLSSQFTIHSLLEEHEELADMKASLVSRVV